MIDRKRTITAAAEIHLDLVFGPVSGPSAAPASEADAVADAVLDLVEAFPWFMRGLFSLAVETAASISKGGRSFVDLPRDERRQAYLEQWGNDLERIPLALLSQLLWLVIYSGDPARQAIGFALPAVPPVDVPPPPGPARLDRSYDVCVIGSGAGGAVVASRAAEAGLHVLLLEEGSWRNPRDYSLRDDRALLGGYRNAGVQPAFLEALGTPSFDNYSALLVLQARGLGGGPAINNAIHVPLPHARWQSWQSEHAFPLDWPPIGAALARVAADLGVTTDAGERCPGERSARLRAGATALNWARDTLPVAVHECIGCGGCNVGCRYGRKTGGLHGDRPAGAPLSYLERARRSGHVAVRTDVRIERFHRTGSGRRVLLASGADLANNGREIEIRAREYVLSTGVFASSKVLLRSGIGLPVHPAGRWVSANLVLPSLGIFPEPFGGPCTPGLQMCDVLPRDGYFLESWFHYPGSISLLLSQRPDEHAGWMRRFTAMSACGVLVPTDRTGSLSVSWDPMFKLTAVDMARLRDGTVDAVELLFAAGAEVVIPALRTPRTLRRDSWPADRESLRSSLHRASDFLLSTAHPQGGNVMGEKARQSVIGADFRVHGVENLTVADASVFPSGCGVSPQMTVMALAHLAADALVGRG